MFEHRRAKVENMSDLVRTSGDDQPFLCRVISDRENLPFVSLVFVGWIRASSSVPAKLKDQNVSKMASTSTQYIISVLSSPTLAKIFSF